MVTYTIPQVKGKEGFFLNPSVSHWQENKDFCPVKAKYGFESIRDRRILWISETIEICKTCKRKQCPDGTVII